MSIEVRDSVGGQQGMHIGEFGQQDDSKITAVVKIFGQDLLAAGAENGTVAIWDCASMTRVMDIRMSEKVRALAPMVDGRLAVGYRSPKIRVYDPLTGKRIGEILRKKDERAVDSLVQLPTGGTCVSHDYRCLQRDAK